MKKSNLFLLTLACASTALFALASCEGKPEDPNGNEGEHTHVSKVVTGKKATCTETGLTDGEVCSVCGETLKAQEVIPALGHAFDEGKVTAQALARRKAFSPTLARGATKRKRRALKSLNTRRPFCPQ